MKKERFYYSPDLNVIKLEILTYKGEMIAAGPTLALRKLPRVTICGILSEDKKTMTFGAARCSAKDLFIKSKGREMARSRVETSPIKVVSINEGDKISQVFMDNAILIEQEILNMPYPVKVS